jgi:AcrR family transcriptional regulator
MSIRVARKKPDSYQHGDLREALIQAGLKLLTEQGLAGFSLRGAAQLAGVSHAAPYRHFADKQALVAAIAERGFRLLTASMREELAESAPSRTIEKLYALGAGYVRFGTRHPDYLRIIFGGVINEEASADLAAAGEEAYSALRGVVEAGLASGELRGGDPDLVSLACWSLVHGLSALLASGAVPPPATPAALRELVAATLRLLGQGIVAPSTTPGGRSRRPDVD